MKKQNLLCAGLAAVMLTLGLSACSDVAISKYKEPAGMKSVNLMSSVADGTKPSVSIADDFTGGYTAFSLNLLDRAAAGSEGDVLVSPLSVSMALGLTAGGAGGDTKAAFDQLFGSEQAKESFNALMTLLTDQTSPEVLLTLANAIWVDDSFTANPDFLQTNANFFDAGVYQTDLQKKETVKDINKWIALNTGDKIRDLVENLDENAKMLLVNALYFKAPWENPFLKASNGTFHAPGGDVTVPMMGQSGRFSYFMGDGFKAVLLPYQDSSLAFLAVLPDEGTHIRDFSLSPEDYRAIIAGEETACFVRMPVFTAQSRMNLNGILSDMGLAVAFDPEKADFSKMGSSVDNLFIGNVSHATWMAVTETGTEAAATTSVEMVATGAVLEPPPEIILDRPFLYGIVDKESTLPLFLGILSNP